VEEREYRRAFSRTAKDALDRAWLTRNFEIELYWKRATYFWATIGVAFAGFVAAQSNSGAKPLAFLIGMIGLIFSLAWYLVNRGSAAWQRNWENHVDMLEDGVTGPLHKTVTDARALYRFADLLGPLPISPSRVNAVVSLYVVVIWVGLIVYALPNSMLTAPCSHLGHWLAVAATVGATVCLVAGGRSRSTDDGYAFRKRQRKWR
jgi:hypothetical protein